MRLNIKQSGKPTFKINIRPPKPATEFQRLVKEAITVWRQLDQMRVPSGESKLSANAFLRETLKAAPEATLQRVKALRGKLEAGAPSLDNARRALAQMCKELKGPNIRTPPTPDKWGRTERWLMGKERTPVVLGELTAIGHSSVELFGVAILVTSATNPEVFGSADSTQADLDADIAALTKKRDELLKRIERAWTADDVEPGQYIQGHTSPTTFKGTSVDVAPSDGSGKRLVEYLMSNRP
jgi:hypothetical protein